MSGFTVSGLSNYTEENEDILLRASQLTSKTASLVEVQPGIKSAATLNILTPSAEFQAGGSCGFNASGSTTITQRTITIGDVKVQDSFCPKDLEAKYTQKMLKAGSHYEEVPFEKDLTDAMIEVLHAQLETADWQGDTTSGVNNLKHYDGLLKIIDAASPVSASTSTINTTNIRTIYQDIYAQIPAAVLAAPDMVSFCGYDTARVYQTKLAQDNLFHYSGEASKDIMGLTIENSTIPIIPVNGLNGTNRIITGRKSNFYLGVDLLNEEDSFRIWYSKDDDNVKFSTEFKRGWQIAFPGEIVEYQNA